MLHAVNALVLRSVVHKRPPDILHTGNKLNIGNENKNADYALQHCHQAFRLNHAGKQPCDKKRKQHENPDSHDKRQNHDESHQGALQLLPQHPVQKLLYLSRLRILVVLKEAGGIGQRLHTHNHGIRKAEYASDKGQGEQLHLLGNADIQIPFNLYFLVRFPDCHRIIVPVHHHDPLDDSLSSDS